MTARTRGARARGWRSRWVLLLLVPVLGACSVEGLAFRKDERLSIDNLPDRSVIDVPFRLEFSFDDVLDPSGAAAFAVLVDWTPPPPGEPLERLLADDPSCRGTAGCPEGYLERNRIHVTTDTSFVIEDVPVGTDRDERRGAHEVTIILVDASRRRVGETAAWSRFRVPERER